MFLRPIIMNIFTYNNVVQTRVFAVLTAVSMILSALPVHIFVAEAQQAIAVISDPTGTLNTVDTPYVTPHGKIDICHWDADGTTFVPNSPNLSSIVGGIGHGGHAENIIPPFWHQFDDQHPQLYPGKNWNDGMEIWNNDCVVPTGTIVIEKLTLPEGGQTDFDFTGDLGAFILNGNSSTSFEVETGTYDVTETDEDGWTLASLTCSVDGDDGSTWDRSDTTVIINLEAEDTVTCQFGNRPIPPTSTVTICKYEDEVLKENLLNGWVVGLSGELSGVTGFEKNPDGCLVLEDVPYDEYKLREKIPEGPEGWFNVSGNEEVVLVDEATETFNLVNSRETPVVPACDYGFGPDNLLSNGSFEEPVADENTHNGGFWEVFDVIPGWTSDGGFELWNNMFGGASDGEQNAELAVDAPTTITQPVVTIPGATYELRFDFAAREGKASGVDNNSIEAAADGNVVVAAATDNTDWVEYSNTFVAGDASTDITFADKGTPDGLGTLLDNAVLCLVREPATKCEVTLVSDETDYVVEKDDTAKALSFIHTGWTAVIAGATWIWGDDPIMDPSVDETQTFIKKFGFEGNVTSATLYVASDNSHDADLNGSDAGEATEEQNFRITDQDEYDVTSLIAQGNNELSIAVKNWAGDANPEKNPAGLMYKLHIEGEVTTDKDCSIPYEEEPDLVTIDGNKWNDEDGDGYWDEDEDGIERWGIALRPMAMKAVEELHVSAESAAVVTTSNMLTSGRTYIIEASGTYSFGNRDDFEADAEWSHRADAYTDNPLAAHGWTVGELTYPSVVGLDLQIDGQNISWGSFNDDHLYKTVVEGGDTALDFSIYDSAYGDNTGGLDVAIYDVTDYVTYTNGDGYYSFEVEAGEYQIVEIMQEGWTQTYPSEPSYYHVTVPEERKGGYDFGNMEDYVEIPGCTDSAATNYNAKANVDDGSCEYPLACEAGVNLIANGSFEDVPVEHEAGWDIFPNGFPNLAWAVEWFTDNFANDPPKLAGQLELHGGVNGWLPSSGIPEEQYAELDSDWEGPGGTAGEEASVVISQTIATIPGEEYELSWDFSPRPDTLQPENDLEVFVEGLSEVKAGDNTGTGGSQTDWTSHNYVFTADSDETTVSFRDDGNPNSVGTFLDNVSLICNPEPSAQNYCGDGERNQEWEQCDGTDGCTNYCTLENQCTDLKLVKITLDEKAPESKSFDGSIYLGSATNPIPNGTWFNFDEAGDTGAQFIANDTEGLGVERDQDAGTLNFAFVGGNSRTQIDYVVGSVETMGIELDTPVRSLVPGYVLENGSNGFDDVFDRNAEHTGMTFDMRADTGNDGAFVGISGVEDPYNCPAPLYTIQGYVWHDDNENDIWDGFEEGGEEEQFVEVLTEDPQVGWKVSITNGEDTFSTTTDANGYYYFNVPAGTWTVTEEMQSGWGQTFPDDGTHVVTVPEVFTQAEEDSFFATVLNYIVPTAHADVLAKTVYGDYNFGNNEVVTITTLSSGGGGSTKPSCRLFESDISDGEITLTWETRRGRELTITADGTEVFSTDNEDRVDAGRFITSIGATLYELTVSKGSREDTCIIELDGPEGRVLGEQVSLVPNGAPDAGAGGAAPTTLFYTLIPAAFIGRKIVK